MTSHRRFRSQAAVALVLCVLTPARAVEASGELEARQLTVIVGNGFLAGAALYEAARSGITEAINQRRLGRATAALEVIDTLLAALGDNSVVVQFRLGMFPETVSPRMIKLMSHVELGECDQARALYPVVEKEISGMPGSVFGMPGLQRLRGRCGF